MMTFSPVNILQQKPLKTNTFQQQQDIQLQLKPYEMLSFVSIYFILTSFARYLLNAILMLY